MDYRNFFKIDLIWPRILRSGYGVPAQPKDCANLVGSEAFNLRIMERS